MKTAMQELIESGIWIFILTLIILGWKSFLEEITKYK
jgi:hypothetical protein